MAPPPDTLELICADFNGALDLLRGLGLRLDAIFPADEPTCASLSKDGISVRLATRAGLSPPPERLPQFQPGFVLTRAGNEGGEGRAGMLYRDLIPGRLGGRYIASHITIPDGGPVADWVHFHRIAIQLLCVRRGQVRVVYEGQGDPFVMDTGDMVVQPPGIRHRVLESSPGLEVVEITCPAFHETLADHGMDLPNAPAAPGRCFAGQQFLHHVAATASWTAWNGAEAQATHVGTATNGIAEARIVRPGAAPRIAIPPHDGELVFGFVLEGAARLECGTIRRLGPADAFTIPPGQAWSLDGASDNFRLLHVTTGCVDADLPDCVAVCRD